MTEYKITQLICSQGDAGTFIADGNLYNARYVSSYSIGMTPRRTKLLRIELIDGDTLLYESEPKGILSGFGTRGMIIDDFDRRYPAMRRAAEERAERDRRYEQHMNARTYAFLIKTTEGLAELCNDTNFDEVWGWKTHISRLLMMPCGIRGHRLLTIYHDDESIRDAACDIARKYYGDKIVKEGLLAVCEIGERKMIKWEFMLK